MSCSGSRQQLAEDFRVKVLGVQGLGFEVKFSGFKSGREQASGVRLSGIWRLEFQGLGG